MEKQTKAETREGNRKYRTLELEEGELEDSFNEDGEEGEKLEKVEKGKMDFIFAQKVDCSGWMGGWMGGWVDGWMGGCKSRVKDCLQQSKINHASKK